MPAPGELQKAPGALPLSDPADGRSHQRSRSKSMVLRSLIGHRKTISGDGTIPSTFSIQSKNSSQSSNSSFPNPTPTQVIRPEDGSLARDVELCNVFRGGAGGGGRPLEELHLQQNHTHETPSIRSHSASPTKTCSREDPPAKTPSKIGFPALSFKSAVKESRRFGKLSSKDKDKNGPPSPTKPKKSKSSTNIAGLLSLPKSDKSLKQLLVAEDESGGQSRYGGGKKLQEKDKENRTPPATVQTESADDISQPPSTPIYAQFASKLLAPTSQTDDMRDPIGRYSGDNSQPSYFASPQVPIVTDVKKCPNSFQQYGKAVDNINKNRPDQSPNKARSRRTWDKDGALVALEPDKVLGSRHLLMTAFTGVTERTNLVSSITNASGTSSSLPLCNSGSSAQAPKETDKIKLQIDPQDVDKHLEALLDRRNIPENQRYKMRNLNSSIKMEFIRQDWAETQGPAVRESSEVDMLCELDERRVGSAQTRHSAALADAAGQKEAETVSASNSRKPKVSRHTRVKSWTQSKVGGSNSSKGSNSDSVNGNGNNNGKKPKTEGVTLGRSYFRRSKSNESLMAGQFSNSGSARPVISSQTRTNGASSLGGMVLLAKVKGQQGPTDYVAYLRKVQKPELVEVGKLHKLRLLLRNETVAWTEEFIRQGGMEEIVGLLHRIMEVEWREEHEDALLHGNLLCLKALCTTALALQYLHSIHASLFPAMLHMIFDPEKRGPSEFTTRGIITSILLTYIECAMPQERTSRAQAVLSFLRDPDPKEEERPLDFVLEMRQPRPYRVWCKEVVSVTKEVFWIFLHHLNIVALESERMSWPDTGKHPINGSSHEKPPNETDGQYAYMAHNFPQQRPPVPAAPYVGGVEWDATNYLASHLDLMNAILACSGPTARERNALRAELRISGWERCMGGSLRLCKEKFYGAVHDGLRTWVQAAHVDGWDVRDVRYGPARDSRSTSPAKRTTAGGPPLPKLEIPKLDFAIDYKGSPLLNEPRSAIEPSRKDAWLS